ncbi:hypothetical protein HMPREF9440_01856 [Sutterella parvirubra YIT 11816]|uniref:Uncharacterized protein n=1 Tax=Sutterella parvirubra YIT 11816 TaxID=762967 RepID=H3KGH6_9BURK|nr:hypothetical protein HMPREF9440_01856 [Sutterella parvirubra YIT 11816]
MGFLGMKNSLHACNVRLRKRRGRFFRSRGGAASAEVSGGRRPARSPRTLIP